MEMIGMPVTIALTYAIVSVLRVAFKKYPSFENFVPLISSVLGAVLSIVEFYAFPSIVLTQNIFHAILAGLFMGLSASGSELLVKQIKDYVDANNKKMSKAK